ncbi:hypothetical protein [Paraburkholderia sp.]|uniref:hypothetical protein n=1 Tax=Paraburkholderia sp. TaxID=1926495 RepID=UPI002B003963|nr:hypothetical protein [Paraburkholderia sp.]
MVFPRCIGRLNAFEQGVGHVYVGCRTNGLKAFVDKAFSDAVRTFEGPENALSGRSGP